MKVLVTGGAGYIGTELSYLLSADERISEVVIYDNFSRNNHNLFIGHRKFPNANVKFIQGELLDTRKIKSILKDTDVVFHLAARTMSPFSGDSSHLFEQVNHWGTAELVYAVEQSDVKSFVYLSSTSVYGASSKEVDVDSPLNPRTFYGISKMRGEEHVMRLFKKMPTYLIRCGNVYGYSKSMRFDAVINKFMFDANFNHRISVHGDGNQRRSFVHVDRVSALLNELLSQPIKSGTYDLVDHVLSVNDVAEKVEQVYPDMEMLFVNQHLQLKELVVKKNEQINQLIPGEVKSFEDDLQAFKQAFTF